MTQTQQDSVTAATQNFVAKGVASAMKQKAASDAAAATAAALANATVAVPAECRALQLAANDAYFNAQAAQQDAIAEANQAQADLGKAQVDLQSAVLESLQTGAAEQV